MMWIVDIFQIAFSICFINLRVFESNNNTRKSQFGFLNDCMETVYAEKARSYKTCLRCQTDSGGRREEMTYMPVNVFKGFSLGPLHYKFTGNIYLRGFNPFSWFSPFVKEKNLSNFLMASQEGGNIQSLAKKCINRGLSWTSKSWMLLPKSMIFTFSFSYTGLKIVFQSWKTV